MDMMTTTQEANIRAALARHWAASNEGNDEVEGEIYGDDVELMYPQSGERFRGRRNVLESRGKNPAKRRFEIQRTVGSGGLWIIEYTIFYDERPTPTVSIMEFREGKVARETQYFADRFEAPGWPGVRLGANPGRPSTAVGDGVSKRPRTGRTAGLSAEPCTRLCDAW